MKFHWLFVAILGIAAARPTSAQVSAYVDFSALKLTGGLPTTTTNVLYGPTIGLTGQLGTKAHLKFYGDLRAGFYGTARRMDGLVLGPKVGLPLHNYELSAEFMVGFARYNDGLGNPFSASTDAQTEVNVALDRRVTERLDWRVVEYSYSQFYGLGGEYNPKTFSTGVVLHMGAR